METVNKKDTKKYDDRKIFAAIACLFIGFIFIWNVAAHSAAIYQLKLDPEACTKVRTLGLEVTDNCFVTAPYRPIGVGPGGYIVLPDGNDIQVTPVEEKRTNQGAGWTPSMRLQMWIALAFWVATLVLIVSAFWGKKSSE